ncbi:MAG: TIGR03862 family flavoprotein [Variibacter sp.]
MIARKNIAVVGGGPAGLMAADVAAAGGAQVTVYDAMPTLGRKLLMAGRGGLNLTHSEDLEKFFARYGAAAPYLRAAIEAFPPQALRDFAQALGQETFVGSSGRVFPKALKASPLLRAWLRRLGDAGVVFHARHRWIGFAGERGLRFATPDGEATIEPDAVVLALGGASWPRLGSDGAWTDVLARKGVAVTPLVPSNCGFRVDWSEHFRDRFEGAPLKRIALAFGGRIVRGEAMITRDGIEGGAVYALSPALRDAIEAKGDASLTIDLRPDLDENNLARRLATPRGKASFSNFLRKATKLSPAAIGLLNETKDKHASLAAIDPEYLAVRIKSVPLKLAGIAPIARAISSAGGVRFDAIDANFMLRARPGVFVAGEMLDWEAPTGGYLLQACFATGRAAGQGALGWMSTGNR